MTDKSIDNSVETAEKEASKILFPELLEHLNYANDVYNLAFKAVLLINGKKRKDVSDVTHAQIIILARITDFLRCIQLLCRRGYPEQACTLAASIFELTQTALFFEHSPDTAKKWNDADSIKEEMPWGILGKSWKRVVKANCKHLGYEQAAERLSEIYKQLCWMKHSLPKMQDMRVEENQISPVFGPHTDERAISHAWFALEHSGRLTEWVISLLLKAFNTLEMEQERQGLATKQRTLTEKAIKRFGQEIPK